MKQHYAVRHVRMSSAYNTIWVPGENGMLVTSSIQARNRSGPKIEP